MVAVLTSWPALTWPSVWDCWLEQRSCSTMFSTLRWHFCRGRCNRFCCSETPAAHAGPVPGDPAGPDHRKSARCTGSGINIHDANIRIRSLSRRSNPLRAFQGAVSCWPPHSAGPDSYTWNCNERRQHVAAGKAFSSGCTAMTGVEAVSNGVQVFREPRTRNARATLTTIIAILILLLAGIAYLCRAYGIAARPPGQPGYESLLSQLTAAVSGRGVFYFATMVAILSVLSLSANTSFADFPRLCRAIAENAGGTCCTVSAPPRSKCFSMRKAIAGSSSSTCPGTCDLKKAAASWRFLLQTD
jgi:hypothetical protein